MPDLTIAQLWDRAMTTLPEIRVLRVVIDYRSSSQPLAVASSEDWIAKFRRVVGPDGYAFEGRPAPGETIILWRATRQPEHANGLSWTDRPDVARAYARADG